MEDEKKLYPFRICSILDEYGWGQDEFKLADLGYRDSLIRDGWLAGNSLSEIMDTYMDRVVGDNVFTFYGRQFPVQLKYIHVKGKMPLRVHPDDEIASQRYDLLGREKLWYVARAGKDARLMIGFKRDTTASEVYSKCLDNTVDDLLNITDAKEGAYFHIAPGVPHAASGDLLLVEVSESSPLDFCMCGWGGNVSEDEFDPSLNLIDALDFIDYRKYDETICEEASGTVRKIIRLPQFTAAKVYADEPLSISSEGFDSFTLYNCLSGSASIQMDILGQTAKFDLNKGDTMLIPAECPDFILVPEGKGAKILEITVPDCKEQDSYINPDVPEKPDGDDEPDPIERRFNFPS